MGLGILTQRLPKPFAKMTSGLKGIPIGLGAPRLECNALRAYSFAGFCVNRTIAMPGLRVGQSSPDQASLGRQQSVQYLFILGDCLAPSGHQYNRHQNYAPYPSLS